MNAERRTSAPVPSVSGRDHAGVETTRTLTFGLFGGLGLGIVARGWMRLIADKPEFSWSGTLFIVLGFTVFSSVQAAVAVVRRRASRRRTLTAARVVGVVAMLPLFVAAGAVMAPTVILGGLAVVRSDWHRTTRAMFGVLATAPVMFVTRQIVQSFGWSWHSLAGVTALLAIYTLIVAATRHSFAPYLDGWRLTRWGRITTVAVGGGIVLVPLVIGGLR